MTNSLHQHRQPAVLALLVCIGLIWMNTKIKNQQPISLCVLHLCERQQPSIHQMLGLPSSSSSFRPSATDLGSQSEGWCNFTFSCFCSFFSSLLTFAPCFCCATLKLWCLSWHYSSKFGFAVFIDFLTLKAKPGSGHCQLAPWPYQGISVGTAEMMVLSGFFTSQDVSSFNNPGELATIPADGKEC